MKSDIVKAVIVASRGIIVSRDFHNENGVGRKEMQAAIRGSYTVELFQVHDSISVYIRESAWSLAHTLLLTNDVFILGT